MQKHFDTFFATLFSSGIQSLTAWELERTLILTTIGFIFATLLRLIFRRWLEAFFISIWQKIKTFFSNLINRIRHGKKH